MARLYGIKAEERLEQILNEGGASLEEMSLKEGILGIRDREGGLFYLFATDKKRFVAEGDPAKS